MLALPIFLTALLFAQLAAHDGRNWLVSEENDDTQFAAVLGPSRSSEINENELGRSSETDEDEPVYHQKRSHDFPKVQKIFRPIHRRTCNDIVGHSSCDAWIGSKRCKCGSACFNRLCKCKRC